MTASPRPRRLLSQPRRRRRGVGALVATLVLVAGCGSGGDDASDAETSTVAMADTVTIAVPPTELTVQDTGTEPRISLGGTLPDDATTDVPVFSSTEIYQTIDDQPEQNFSTPAVTFDVTASAGDDNAIDMRLNNVSSPDQGLADVLSPANGAEVSVTVDAQRAITEMRITPTQDSSDTARGTLEQAIYQLVYRTVVVPDEPVGVGALWQFTQNVDSGLILSQTTTATVREIDGDSAVIDLVVEQHPTSDTWTLPQGSGTLRVDNYVSSGTGSVTIDPSQPLPTTGGVTLQGDQAYSDPNSPTTLKQRTSNVLRYGE